MSRFSDLYLQARSNEGRLLQPADLELRPLDPPVATRQELRFRNSSYQRLRAHLRSRARTQSPPNRILEIGCGTGWLCARLSQDFDAAVVGVDVAVDELVRASRRRNVVLPSQKTGAGPDVLAPRRPRTLAPRLRLVAAELDDNPFQPQSFDVVIGAAVAQYFPCLDDFVRRALSLCADNGQLLILDTPFYTSQSLPAARRRSAEYYRNLGCDAMASYYHHHALDDLKRLEPTWIYSPWHFHRRVLRKLAGVGSPFPIVALNKDSCLLA